MEGQIRVFVSHHHSPDEDLFTTQLVADLKTAGADVWVDDQYITANNFVQKISEGLEDRQWLVLVMTPQSVASPWVRNEVNTALGEVTAGRMLGVIPILMVPIPDPDIPVLWRPLHRYDASRAYEPARDGLLHALGLRMSVASLQQPVLFPPTTHGPLAPLAVPSGPPYPLPDVPERLANLGFHGLNVNGMPVITPPLVIIPAGPFLMGSDGRRDNLATQDELPQHRVEVGTFHIGKYPVTVAEYTLAVRSGNAPEPRENKGVTWAKQQEYPDHPVVCVSRNDALAYITWLISATGQRGWRLPTEAEWEKAARWDSPRGVSRIYPWGDSFDKARCNTNESGVGTTSPVGSYPANDTHCSGVSPYGVEDMAGNVWEWTSSLCKSYPYIPNDGREDQASTELRRVRGGWWGGPPKAARTAHRGVDSAVQRNSHGLGFRLAYVGTGRHSQTQ